ncbi:MAG: diaminopimelate epimerase [Clostridia bacterium]|nr:diaminopimelate epimerase [Clostridia bacterium]
MQGVGNDYIFFDCFEEGIYEPEKLARRLSDRHFSVGGDGIILVEKSEVADGRMRMFNADGSEGKMCGNGLRCTGRFLYEQRGIRKDELTVETKSGIKTLSLHWGRGGFSATADMGEAVFCPAEIPVRIEGERAADVPLCVNGKEYRVTCLSFGNPHCVIFCNEYPKNFKEIGRAIETHEVFPEGVNVEFVKIVGADEIAVRVWERGSGETLACGTGACAAAVASMKNGHCRGQEITVRLRGGTLTVRCAGNRAYLTGPAENAFEGEVQID